MLSGHNIICFSPNRWDALWRNRQQIMSRLARQNKVLFVEPPTDFRPATNSVRQRGLRALHGARLSSPLPGLWVYQPPAYAPVSGRPPLRDVTFAMRRRSLLRTMRRLGFDQPIVWVFHYGVAEMIGHLGERLSIYHAFDEFSAYELDTADNERQQSIKRRESDVIRRVDLVFVTSPALYESKRLLHPHVVLVRNGVDFDLFAREDGAVPSDIAEIAHPRVGYAGVINEKLDLALLLAVARHHPNWNLILVGPVVLRQDRESLTDLQALPNVHFLGYRPVDALPDYMRAFDAGLIPYKRNEWTRNISPLKLYEYMATGIPIVATDIPAAIEFTDLLGVASEPERFIAALEQAMQLDTPQRRQAQQALARQNTWDQRVEALSAAITQRLIETETIDDRR